LALTSCHSSDRLCACTTLSPSGDKSTITVRVRPSFEKGG
jgi:hypothetical protein